MYEIDAITGVLTATGTVTAGTGPMSIVVDPSGRFAYVGDISSSNLVLSFSVDPSTGILTNTGTLPAGGIYPYPVVVDPSGTLLYAADIDSDNLSIYSIDPGTGVLALAGTVTTTTSPGALVITATIQ
jgi:6-phosphogluconolactonase (cycloisomerase 2 family)